MTPLFVSMISANCVSAVELRLVEEALPDAVVDARGVADDEQRRDGGDAREPRPAGRAPGREREDERDDEREADERR